MIKMIIKFEAQHLGKEINSKMYRKGAPDKVSC